MIKKIRDNLIDYETINDTICKIRVKGRFKNITILSVYALTDEREEIKKERFYDNPDKICSSSSRYDLVLVVVDYNSLSLIHI